MNESYDLKTILNALEEINIKPKNKNNVIKFNNVKNINKNEPKNEEISPVVEKLILEAEKYSQNISNKNFILESVDQSVLILDREYNEGSLVFSELQKKISMLEKNIKYLTNRNNILETSYKEKNILTNSSEEHFINESNLDVDEIDSNKDDSDLSTSVIETLKLQESLIKNFEKNEEKLRLKIVDLEQDLSILKNNIDN